MSDTQAIVWILGGQLLARHPALLAAEQAYTKGSLRIVLIESRVRTQRLRYQRIEPVLLFSATRHYAEDLRQQGYAVGERNSLCKCQSQKN